MGRGPRIASRSGVVAAAAAALVGFALTLAMLRRGVPIGPDGWSYWQASVSLVEGRGYADFFGLPIVDWPPLFPVWVAGFEVLLGVSGAVLALALATTVGLAVLAWSLFLFALLREAAPGTGRGRRWCRAAIGLYVASVLALNARAPRAEVLYHGLLPLLLWACWRGRGSRGRRAAGWCAALGLALAALLETRNAAVVFAPAACFLVAGGSRGRGLRILGGTLACGAALLLWQGTRLRLGQVWDYPKGPGAGSYGALAYLWQLATGVGKQVAPFPVGILVWVGSTLWLVGARPRRRSSGPLLGFTWIAIAALWAAFNLTRVADKLGGRFVVWVPLVTVGLVLVHLPAVRGPRLRIACAAALLALPVGRSVKNALRGSGPDRPGLGPPDLASFVRRDVSIHPDRMRRPYETAGGRVFVVPPLYPWQKRRLERRR